MEYYKSVLKKYAVFEGRARRREFWMFTLFNAIFAIALSIVDMIVGLDIGNLNIGVLNIIYSLAVLLPSLGVTVRRLHDTNRSGWWIFIGVIPFVGPIILLVLLFLDSTPRENKYGSNPKGISAAPTAQAV